MISNNDVYYIGVNDHQIDLFEGQYPVQSGMSYNSYLIADEKTAVFDTVDIHFTTQWLNNLSSALCGRKLDYLIIHHMEPDHSASVKALAEKYPEVTLVGSAKALSMLDNFFGANVINCAKKAVKEGDKLSLGKHELSFIAAPMIHWPEVMMSYESTEKILFSADAFGKFGALDVKEEWTDEARRYYIGIVGKYGAQVQSLLKKAAALEIKSIYPLHGPILEENLAEYIKKYDIWSSYSVESEGTLIAYTSIYGNTKKAVELLTEKLTEKGEKVTVRDLARTDKSFVIAEAFKYGKIVFATTTYNAEIFPFMSEFIEGLVERNFKNRTVAFIENGSWVPIAAKIMKEKLSVCKDLNFIPQEVKILSSLNESSICQIEELANVLSK